MPAHDPAAITSSLLVTARAAHKRAETEFERVEALVVAVEESHDVVEGPSLTDAIILARRARERARELEAELQGLVATLDENLCTIRGWVA